MISICSPLVTSVVRESLAIFGGVKQENSSGLKLLNLCCVGDEKLVA